MATPGDHQNSVSGSSHSIPVAQYGQNRLPDPPRLDILPPHHLLVYGSDGPVLSSFASRQAESHDYGSSEYGNPAFLQALRSSCNLTYSHKLIHWEHHLRWTIQSILPFLLLGPSTMARDTDYVHELGVTMMISLRTTIEARAKYTDVSTFASSVGRSTLTLDLNSPNDLMTRLPHTIKAMNDHLENSCIEGSSGTVADMRGKILVFCESGNDLSPPLVAAYLMILFGVDITCAIQIIQSARSCINPPDSMIYMLTIFEDILKAKREVTMQTKGLANVTKKKAKRALDMMVNEDDGMMEGGIHSEDDGSGRPWAPFQSM